MKRREFRRGKTETEGVRCALDDQVFGSCGAPRAGGQEEHVQDRVRALFGVRFEERRMQGVDPGHESEQGD